MELSEFIKNASATLNAFCLMRRINMLTTLTAVLICLYLGVALTALAVVVIACHDHRSIWLPVWLFCLGVFVLILGGWLGVIAESLQPLL